MKHMVVCCIRNGTTGRLLCAVVLSALLAGCGSSAPLFTRDGRPTIQVQCPGQGPWNACTENARGICSGDIDIIQQSTDNGAHNLLFACRGK